MTDSNAASVTRTLRLKVRAESYGWLNAAAVEVNHVSREGRLDAALTDVLDQAAGHQEVVVQLFVDIAAGLRTVGAFEPLAFPFQRDGLAPDRQIPVEHLAGPVGHARLRAAARAPAAGVRAPGDAYNDLSIRLPGPGLVKFQALDIQDVCHGQDCTGRPGGVL